jgi:hypothetical protein
MENLGKLVIFMFVVPPKDDKRFRKVTVYSRQCVTRGEAENLALEFLGENSFHKQDRLIATWIPNPVDLVI